MRFQFNIMSTVDFPNQSIIAKKKVVDRVVMQVYRICKFSTGEPPVPAIWNIHFTFT